MSVSNITSGSASAYLQSLLQQQSTDGGTTTDPITALLNAFYPMGTSTAQNSAINATAPAGGPPCANGGTQFSPETLGAMISLQSGQSSNNTLANRVQSVFTEFDANGDGLISKSEFENAFGSNADVSKVDALFNTLDANSDGSISQTELTSAAQQSQAEHHHHHHHNMGNSATSGASDPLASLMSGIDGASSSTTNNPDGSSTTTTTYADGSTVTMSTPAPSSQQSSGDGSGSPDTPFNFLEQLIQLQAQMLSNSAGSWPPTIPTI